MFRPISMGNLNKYTLIQSLKLHLILCDSHRTLDKIYIDFEANFE